MAQKKKESIEPFSSKLKRIMTQPTSEEVPKMPAAKYDDLVGADMFSKKKKRKPGL